MWMQISSGHGPAECALAVAHFARHILSECKSNGSDAYILNREPGPVKDTYKSILMAVNGTAADRLAEKYNGTMMWKCQSPYRKNHERKNWFFSCEVYQEPEPGEIDLSNIRVETMRSSGNGGQNVNKVESAVRIIYLPTNLSVVAREERSQALNKKLALARLREILVKQERETESQIKNDFWKQHHDLTRGNQIQVFEGREFKLIIDQGRMNK
jgi:peptide chain release factor